MTVKLMQIVGLHASYECTCKSGLTGINCETGNSKVKVSLRGL